MTVAELIAELNQMDPTQDVVVLDKEFDSLHDVSGLAVHQIGSIVRVLIETEVIA